MPRPSRIPIVIVQEFLRGVSWGQTEGWGGGARIRLGVDAFERFEVPVRYYSLSFGFTPYRRIIVRVCT